MLLISSLPALPATTAIHPPLQALQDLLAITPVGIGRDARLTARWAAVLHSPCVPPAPCLLPAGLPPKSHPPLQPLPPGFSCILAGMGQACLSFFLAIIAFLESADSSISLVCKHWPISINTASATFFLLPSPPPAPPTHPCLLEAITHVSAWPCLRAC